MNAGMFNIVLLVVFISLIYFMMIRPQKKRDKEITDMRSSLKAGDQIVTVGGIVGRIVRINDERILIETGTNKTKMEIVKTAVGSIIKKNSEPEKEKKTESKPEEEVATPNRNKKITPKKLGAKSDSNQTKEESTEDKETE